MEILKKQSWFHRQSLARQLLFGFGLSLTTIGLTTLGINYTLIQTDLEKQVRGRAQSITQSLEFSTEGLLELENRSILRRVVQNYATLPAVLEIAIVAPDGATLASSLDMSAKHKYAASHPELAQVMQQASRSGIEVNYKMVLNGRPVLVEVLPFSSVLFGTSGQRGLAIAILDLKQMQQETEQTFFASTLSLLVGIVIILLFMAALIQKKVLQPLQVLNEAVAHSQDTGTFTMPKARLANEIYFLADTFDLVFRELEAYNSLQSEITHRKQVEAVLRESEARERQKSQQLEQTLWELQQTQTQLVQSEKMSSLGQLVAGVAHEINNPVNFIHGNVHHAEQYTQDLMELLNLYQTHYPDPDSEIQDKAEDIDLEFLWDDLPKLLSSMKVGVNRIREIVQSLRSFSRLDEAEVKDVDIHEGIDSTLMILQNRLKAKPEHPAIEVIKQYGNLPKIECYAGQLNQVFMNILSNAIDALEEYSSQRSAEEVAANPSRITITTEVVNPHSLSGGSIPPDRVAIRITDNGPGISETVQKRLFDPFFTTKPVGKGTGMGMSISHQVITEKHRGSLRCISSPGAGAEFVIEIPLRLRSEPSEPAIEKLVVEGSVTAETC